MCSSSGRNFRKRSTRSRTVARRKRRWRKRPPIEQRRRSLQLMHPNRGRDRLAAMRRPLGKVLVGVGGAVSLLISSGAAGGDPEDSVEDQIWGGHFASGHAAHLTNRNLHLTLCGVW